MLRLGLGPGLSAVAAGADPHPLSDLLLEGGADKLLLEGGADTLLLEGTY